MDQRLTVPLGWNLRSWWFTRHVAPTAVVPDPPRPMVTGAGLERMGLCGCEAVPADRHEDLDFLSLSRCEAVPADRHEDLDFLSLSRCDR